MSELDYLKDRQNQYRSGLAQDQYGTPRSDLGRAIKEITRLHELHLKRTKLTTKMIKERDQARDELEQAQKRERKAFESGWTMYADNGLLVRVPDQMEAAWQHYNKRTETAGDTLLECDHDLITPEDSEYIQWGKFTICTKCKFIFKPDGSLFMKGPETVENTSNE